MSIENDAAPSLQPRQGLHSGVVACSAGATPNGVGVSCGTFFSIDMNALRATPGIGMLGRLVLGCWVVGTAPDLAVQPLTGLGVRGGHSFLLT